MFYDACDTTGFTPRQVSNIENGLVFRDYDGTGRKWQPRAMGDCDPAVLDRDRAHMQRTCSCSSGVSCARRRVSS